MWTASYLWGLCWGGGEGGYCCKYGLLRFLFLAWVIWDEQPLQNGKTTAREGQGYQVSAGLGPNGMEVRAQRGLLPFSSLSETKRWAVDRVRCTNSVASWSFSSGQSMHGPCTVHATTKEHSMHGPCTVPAQWTLDAHSLHGQSLHTPCTVYARSMHGPCTVTYEHRLVAG